MSDINRRRSVAVNIDGIHVGARSPIVVQSMTNTDTVDVEGTALLIAERFECRQRLLEVHGGDCNVPWLPVADSAVCAERK